MKPTLSRLIVLALIAGAVNIAAQPVAERSSLALDRLRAGVWMERGGFDSFEPTPGMPEGAVAVAWDLTLPPPISLTPTYKPAPAPIVTEPRRPIQARQAETVGRLSPCRDLENKARRLRAAAEQCDADMNGGAPYCNVDVRFDSPRIPRSLSAQGARGYARQFEGVASGGSEQSCADFGGQGDAVGYYEKLCNDGDSYACDARQITSLCFDSSSANKCVRECLVDNDPPCSGMDAKAQLNCRWRNHWLCYERTCPKIIPNDVEARCFMQFPKWKKLLWPPMLVPGNGGY